VLRLQWAAGNRAVSGLLVARVDTGVDAGADAGTTTPDVDEGAPGNRPNLDVGDHGPGVSLLQRKLTEVGYPVPVTGTFDAATHGAAVRFQADRRRLHPATGGVGSGTWRWLDAWPAPTNRAIAMSIADVAQLARDAGIPRDQLVTCVAIAMAESGLRPWAYNDRNPNGTVDRGLWQVNQVNDDSDELFSAEINAAWMARLSGRGRSWRAWFTFTSGAHLAFTGTVAAALGLPVPP
jgi:peptidoglycan hydrolase-like protein with peptidoglycan-binding domain